MPIYEYACGKCGHEFEAEQRISDEPIKTCPSCRSRQVKKLISRTSFVLKGGGWYSDLYSSPGAKPDSKDSGADAKTEKKSSDGDKVPDKGKDKPASDSGSKDSKDGKDGKDGKKKAKGSKAAA